MHQSADASKSLQTVIDWAVFGIGALALSTAIAATVVGSDDGRVADAAKPVVTSSAG